MVCQEKKYLLAFAIFLSMAFSFLFHLFETDEVVSSSHALKWLPFRTFKLSGMYGKNNAASFNVYFLYLDRVAAIIAFIFAGKYLHTLSNTKYNYIIYYGS